MTGIELVAAVRALRGSNADICAQAETAWGRPGRTVAHLVCGLGAGSKRIQASWLADAGLDVDAVLEWAGQPYSSDGLHNAMEAVLEWVESAPDASTLWAASNSEGGKQ